MLSQAVEGPKKRLSNAPPPLRRQDRIAHTVTPLRFEIFLFYPRCRSKRHSELLQVFSNTEADKDRIWKIAIGKWNTMTSSMVARAFFTSV